MTTSIRALLVTFAATFALTAQAQLPTEAAARIRALGPVINPPATSEVMAPLLKEREPYVGVTVQRDIAYGPDARHLLDVFTPVAAATGPRPVFMFVHGGAFVRGDRRSPPGGPFYDNVMTWAARNGFVGVNITYRLAPQHTWPAGAQDVGSAVKWVHDNVARFGGDPTRVFLMGHSAGTIHVATYVAHPAFQQVPGGGLAGALLLSGLYEFTEALMAGDGGNKVYYGNDPALWLQRSSKAGLLATRTPLWLGYAELDPPGFVQQALDLNASLCAAGRCPPFKRFDGHSHMSEIFSIDTVDTAVADAILAFTRSLTR